MKFETEDAFDGEGMHEFGTALADVERDIDCSSHAQLLTRA